MQLFTISTLAVALLSGQALAVCGVGSFNDDGQWNVVSNCNLSKNNVYFCGDSGTSVVHKQSQLVLRAGKVDSTVLVTCDGYGFMYHCSSGDEAMFRETLCKDGVQMVQNIKET